MNTFSLIPTAKLPPNCSSVKPSDPSRQKYRLSKPIKTPNFQHLNNRLINQANVGDLNQAISTLDLMSLHGYTADPSTFSLLLKAAIRSRNWDLGKLLHARIAESRLGLDSIIFNSLISLYSKSGDWRKAEEVFEAMGGARNLVSWGSMISCYANNGLEFEAIETFVDMLGFGFCPNEFCFSSVIRACCSDELGCVGEMVHGFALKTGNFDDLCVGCALIDLYVKGFEDLDCAHKVFDKMPERNVVAWTQMITRFVQMGYPEKAIELFLEMERSGCEPDCFTFTSVISACCELEWLSFGEQMHSRLVRSGLVTNASVGCSLVEMYAKCASHGSLVCSRKVFNDISKHNVLSWTAMITACAQSKGHSGEALELYVDMMEGPVSPNRFTLASVLKACTELSYPIIFDQVYCHALKLGLASDKFVGNVLISMYSQLGKMEDARKAFHLLSEKSLVSFNTLLDGYVRNLNTDEAFELFYQIENNEMGADEFTFTSLLSGAASAGAGGKGEQVHGRIVKSGFGSNQHIGNALVSMYSRCGNIEAAQRVFSEMEFPSVISWTSMITGFAKHGFARKALDLFAKMIETGIKPNEVTFVAVISACSHVGMVSEGKMHFASMYSQYGVVPTMEHYACMVDLLGRSGCLVEALEFITSMPSLASALVWRTLLAACLVHGDTQIGLPTAKMVVRRDPNDPASYTLLSNLYASKGQWEDVHRIRADMKRKNLHKEAGCSWIETESGVHKFFVGDTSHSQANDIYEKLNEVVCDIKKMGYNPNTDFVLHDLEEEQKEQYLLQHSEKIAVAYGLISTSKLKPIRIFKNLRICRDCHTAMKYIAKASEREIIVRDSNRFHHFRDGSCSCNDYW